MMCKWKKIKLYIVDNRDVVLSVIVVLLVSLILGTALILTLKDIGNGRDMRHQRDIIIEVEKKIDTLMEKIDRINLEQKDQYVQ